MMIRRSHLGRLLTGLAVVAALTLPSAAHAYWRGGVFFGFAPYAYYPPPLYYAAPPIVYAPPPVVYAQPQQSYTPDGYIAPSNAPETVSARSCDATPYVCPLDRPAASGAPCSCPANQGRAYGRTR